MLTTTRAPINLHANNTSLDDIQSELREHPSRLEEKRVRKYDEQDCFVEDEESVVDGDGDDDGYTPLMAAACFGNDVIVEFLLSIGANIETKNEV